VAIVDDLIERSGLSDCDVYMQATRGIAPRNHLFPNVPASISMTVKPFRAMDETLREQGAKVKLLPDERWQNCWIKTLNLLPNLLAKQEAFEAGAFEAVLVRDGIVTEGSSSNIFLVKDGTLITPPATKHILHGITRIAVLSIAAELGVPVKEEQFAPDVMFEADEVFLTSTGIEIVPVTSVDNHNIGSGKPGDITKKVYEAFIKRV
jgi:D-alanine transaminase